mgnify:CR=1 FL=1
MTKAIEKITIGGKDYVPVDSIVESNSPVKIVILQRGWIMIGYFERNGSDCILKKSSTIRKWGTTKGLGELVNGPTKDTILDKNYGDVEFDYLTVVASINCNEKEWSKYL